MPFCEAGADPRGFQGVPGTPLQWSTLHESTTKTFNKIMPGLLRTKEKKRKRPSKHPLFVKLAQVNPGLHPGTRFEIFHKKQNFM